METDETSPAARVRQRMKHWMDTTGVGQRDFSGDLHKSQIWLQKILKGENHVRLKDLDEVAQAMRTTASDLVRGDDERYQLELTPTEVRILERMRRRPEAFTAIASLLGVPTAVLPDKIVKTSLKFKKR
jgi:transcriptional regulator with XRE-family HTH domain